MSHDRAVFTPTLSGTAASRRHLAAISTENGAPSAAGDGVDISGARYALITLEVGTNACEVLLWTYDRYSEKWAADTVYGTQALATGTHRFWLEAPGADEVYVELHDNGAAGTLEAWVRRVQF